MHKCNSISAQNWISRAVLAALSVSPLAACSANGPPPDFQKGTLRVKDQLVVVEIADSDQSRQYGLMFRNFLPTNQGMWFEFDYTAEHCMWMKNTPIDLDVAFVGENMRIINIANMRANTSTIHCALGPARYALEMNSNWFAKHSISFGELIKKADQ